MTRVLSYPPRHDYVDRLHGHAAELVHRDVEWPQLSPYYDPDWLDAHRGSWDVAHLHFTWEQHPVERFAEVLATHRRHGTPVVWTAHDLRNPHTGDATADEPYLRLLAEHASAVVTLTAGAAREVQDRFGRTSLVIPHGPLTEPVLRPAPSTDGPTRLLLHAKSLRANLDWLTPMAVVADLHAEGLSVSLDVGCHPDVADQVGAHARDGVEVTAHERLPFGGLCDRIAAADALLLPYRWGTHSGMLELATDLGTPTIHSDVGYLSQQAPGLPVRVVDGQVDVDALRAAITAAANGRLPGPVPPSARRRALAELRRAHRDLYRRVTNEAARSVDGPAPAR